MTGTRPLDERVRDEIRASGPMPFARFMERALYDESQGYYAAGSRRLGPAGDYVTVSDVGRAFGRCVARLLIEFDHGAAPSRTFDVLEFGAGRGRLARDVIDAAGDLDRSFADRLRYTLVDRSEAMRAAAAAAVPEAEVVAPDAIPTRGHGSAIAVELFDALPVHRVRRSKGRLTEVCVGLRKDGDFVEIETAPTEEVRAMAERYGAAAEEGFEAEVAPMAPLELERMARALDSGLLLIVDYGDRAAELYARPHGTLLCYRGHTTNQAYLDHVGEQDLTAHVNFSALEDTAREIGLVPLTLTSQDRFLVANGILEQFEAADDRAWRDPSNVKRRQQALQLIHPDGMGRTFKVLVLAKGCDPLPELAGLADPFSRR